MVGPYTHNPYRILGLPPLATMRDVSRRVSEFRAHHLLNINPTYPNDLPWLRPVDRSPDAIRQAAQRLEDPLARLEESLFWFDPEQLGKLSVWITLSPGQSALTIKETIQEWRSETTEVPRISGRTQLNNGLENGGTSSRR